jgi:hypothetical protein
MPFSAVSILFITRFTQNSPAIIVKYVNHRNPLPGANLFSQTHLSTSLSELEQTSLYLMQTSRLNRQQSHPDSHLLPQQHERTTAMVAIWNQHSGALLP